MSKINERYPRKLATWILAVYSDIDGLTNAIERGDDKLVCQYLQQGSGHKIEPRSVLDAIAQGTAALDNLRNEAISAVRRDELYNEFKQFLKDHESVQTTA